MAVQVLRESGLSRNTVLRGALENKVAELVEAHLFSLLAAPDGSALPATGPLALPGELLSRNEDGTYAIDLRVRKTY